MPPKGRKILAQYKDPKIGLVGLNTFAKRIDKPVEEVKEALIGDEAYTMNRPSAVNVKNHNIVNVVAPYDTIGMDLMDVRNKTIKGYINTNDNVQYLLMCVDIFSSYAWVFPIKDKSAKETKDAMEKCLEAIAEDGGKVNKIWTDKGKEFYNKIVESFLKEKGIELYSTNSGVKVPQCERKIRFLRQIMARLADSTGNWKYVDKLDDMVENMNNTPNRMRLKLTPDEVLKDERYEEDVRAELNGRYSGKNANLTLHVGDSVKITQIRNPFAKESTHDRWSSEFFTIREVKDDRFPGYYLLVDDKGDNLEGPFYENEVQLVKRPANYRVKEVLDERGSGKNKEYFVSFVGYSDEFNKWVKL